MRCPACWSSKPCFAPRDGTSRVERDVHGRPLNNVKVRGPAPKEGVIVHDGRRAARRAPGGVAGGHRRGGRGVREDRAARAFARPSGTEDVVRVRRGGRVEMTEALARERRENRVRARGGDGGRTVNGYICVSCIARGARGIIRHLEAAGTVSPLEPFLFLVLGTSCRSLRCRTPSPAYFSEGKASARRATARGGRAANVRNTTRAPLARAVARSRGSPRARLRGSPD